MGGRHCVRDAELEFYSWEIYPSHFHPHSGNPCGQKEAIDVNASRTLAEGAHSASCPNKLFIVIM
jgi:hypothetical protein